MQLEFLGIGSFFAKNSFHNNLLINDRILIDCGFMAGQALHANNQSFAQIEHIFITHTHADHIGGLEECAFFHKFMHGGTRPKLYLPSALVDKLWSNSLQGGLEDIETGGAHLSDYFDVVEVSEEFEIEDIPFKIVPTFHVPNKFCCGLTIDNRIYFSGDTQFDADQIIQNGDSAEIIYHDCQFFTGGIHTGLDEMMTLPESLRRKISLMHLPDNYVDNIDKTLRAGFTFAEQHKLYTFK